MSEEVKTRKPETKRKALLMVYTGDGKGKTSAAYGMAFRAVGQGLRVGVVQFIKGKWKTGERKFAERVPEIDFYTMGRGFTWESENLELDKAAAKEAFDQATEIINGGKHDLVILDEITYTVHHSFLELETILDVLKNRPPHVHVVVTGRRAPEEIIEMADLVTEMTKIKHPFEQGVPAQLGVDF